MRPLVSICIPGYKRLDYVRNTLKSIYIDNNDVPHEEFEVIISDNDPDKELSILKEEFPYYNFSYHSSDCEGFMNSYMVLTYAEGEFLKLHNSQVLLNKGSLRTIVEWVKLNKTLKPCITFTDGLLLNFSVKNYKTYDSYMKNLSYYSSWSNGFCIWYDDFNEIKDTVSLNPLFPHSSLFISQKKKDNYIIDDTPLCTIQTIPKRGGHNKFTAFTLDYPSLLNDEYKKGNISKKTYKKILRDLNIYFLPYLIFTVKIAKRETFTDEGFKENIKVYYPSYAYALSYALSPLSIFYLAYRRFRIALWKKLNRKD